MTVVGRIELRRDPMPESVYLQWNLVNWVTVVLMVFVALFVLGMGASAIRHYNGTASVAA